MNLPFVSRLAYESVVSERDRLRTQNEELIGQIVRLTRRGHGMSETPPKSQAKRGEAELPKDIVDYSEEWDSPAYQSLIKNRAWQLFREKGSRPEKWGEILTMLQGE
jgi:hypothetical protein